MPKGRLALVAAVVIALVCVPFAFLSWRPSPPIVLHFLQGAQVGDSFSATFGISNRTGRAYFSLPLRLEALEGGAWKEVKQGIVECTQTADGGAFRRAFGLIEGRPVTPTLTLTIKRVP